MGRRVAAHRDGVSFEEGFAVNARVEDRRLPTPVVICGVRFEFASYDEEGDLLWLTRGVPLGAADGDTPEGHSVFLGDSGRVIGLLVNGARWHLERDDTVDVTLRSGGRTTRLARATVEPLLVETIRY
jgi:hypothetical protein